MNMNKQTVWLVTMLSLMVVLSAYYIVTGPVEPADQVAMEDQDGDPEGVQVDTEEKDKGDEENKGKDEKASAGAESDYFVGYQLQRSSLRSKMTEDYMEVLTDPESSKKELKEAQAKIDELMKVDKSESVMEDLIREEGYRDAVVITGDNQMVDVIVQSKKLSKKQVVQLISMVKKQMDIPSHKVSVAYRN
ncbi:stage III sporulation protein AH [Melghirimyces thermohalophilus]|uniref:Stage III sporulation protein AH n=1 Tax=Melghirimyces thermohalophilus TaxID=1236220 RepID=A0A1G6Q8H4_9BACL|nr:SpoIIIAH-like family protein [Melghirimyces thermohalophilus]SDC88802.1 stage III sporulation protein AH [Melghirimyces thermohalophilus]